VLTLNCAPWHWVLLTPLVSDTEEVIGAATENLSNTNLIEQMSLEPLQTVKVHGEESFDKLLK